MNSYKEEILSHDEAFPVEVFISDNQKDTIYVEPHFHECVEILFMLEGNANQQVNNHSISLEKHDMLILNEGDIHSTYCEPFIDTKILVIKFMPEIINSSGTRNFESKYIYAFMYNKSNRAYHLADILRNSGDIYTTMMELLTEYTEKKPGYEIYIKGYLYQIIGGLIRNQVITSHDSAKSVGDIKKIDTVLKYIEKHYYNKIDLKTAAKLLNLSESYFCRYFKRMTGRTFKDYINFVRICEVEKLILSRDINISEAAYEVGFCNVSSFNRVFKRIRKYPPGDIKKSITAKK